MHLIAGQDGEGKEWQVEQELLKIMSRCID